MDRGNNIPNKIRRGEMRVRTVVHVRHSTDFPGGEIAVEGIRIEKHCTHRHNNKKAMRKKWRGKQTFDQIENHQCKPKNGRRNQHTNKI